MTGEIPGRQDPRRWSRRDILAAGLGVGLGTAAAVLLPVADMGRPGEDWIAEAESIERHAAEWGPARATASARSALDRLGAALARAPRERDRRPLHIAAALVGAVAGRCSRWSGLDPSDHLGTALEHAEAAQDGPTIARVLIQQAAALTETLHLDGPPCPQEKDFCVRALRSAGANRHSSSVRFAARWGLALEYAASGERHWALCESEAATVEGQLAGLPVYDLHMAHGEVMARCGLHRSAMESLTRALAGPPIRRVRVMGQLALSQARTGNVDAAAATLQEAALLTRTTGAPGRLGRVHAVRAILPPCRTRDQLDGVLYG